MPHPKLQPIPFTPEGYRQLKTDLDRYTQERKQVLVRLQAAREMGKAVVDKTVGDKVVFTAPAGPMTYTIISIK